MNTKSPLFAPKSEDELLHEEEYVLMANYLSEIERLHRLAGLKFTRKELATKIGTSASYLTQVFTGMKPLNFKTIAKIQKHLGIRFTVTAEEVSKSAIKPHYNYQLKNSYPTFNIKDLKPDLKAILGGQHFNATNSSQQVGSTNTEYTSVISKNPKNVNVAEAV